MQTRTKSNNLSSMLVLFFLSIIYREREREKGVYMRIECLSRNDNISNRNKLKRKYRHRVTWARVK